MNLLLLAALQCAAYFIVSLGYLSLSRLLLVRTVVFDVLYLGLNASGLLVLVSVEPGPLSVTAYAFGGASGSAAAILLARRMGWK